MAKKPPKPAKLAKLTRKEEKAYAVAVARVGAALASAKNDPSAAVEAARGRVAKSIDEAAARSPSTAKTVKLAKHGNFRPG